MHRRRVPARHKPKVQPWITPELQSLLRSRKYAHRRAMANPGNSALLWKYRHIRRQGTLLNRRLKIQYYVKLLRSNKSNPRQHWQVIKKITGMARTRQPVPVSCSQLSAFFSGTVSCPSRQTLHLPVGPQLKGSG